MKKLNKKQPTDTLLVRIQNYQQPTISHLGLPTFKEDVLNIQGILTKKPKSFSCNFYVTKHSAREATFPGFPESIDICLFLVNHPKNQNYGTASA